MKTRFVWPILFCLILLLAIPAAAKDTWISVRSKNFNLIGNASEKEIRGVATKLEQFRETFRRLFPRNKFDSPIQTNVVVFKSGSAYNPFRPKLANGKPDTAIAGYFQSGEDINYITLSTEGEKADTYGTIFHEYVHFLLDTHFGKSDVPPWFNEGLAEYYQTFSIEDDIKVLLGNIQDGHLQLLQQSKLIPLKTFFQIDNYSLHQNGNHSRSIFYAQAWALIHYLIQGNKGANGENLSKFLSLIMSKVEPEKAFQQTFGYNYTTMEEALKKYVAQRTFQATMFTAKEKMVFDTEMTTSPLSEADANGYLGDLLYHTHEYTDAEVYLAKALAADENQERANIALGLVKMRQNKFEDAKKYLEKAIASGPRNHYAYYNYAFILSRENMDEFGYSSNFPADKAKKMRAALLKAIEISPHFSGSYRLLSFINMVNNENLDEALDYLKKGLAVQPGNQEYILQIAQIFLRQQKFKEAKEIAQNLTRTASEPEIHSSAQSILNSIQQYESVMARNEELRKQYENSGGGGGGRPAFPRPNNPLTEEEEKKIREDTMMNSMNRQLVKPREGETRTLGYIQKVVCAGGTVTYTIKTDSETFNLASKDFAGLELLSLTPETETLQFGCAAKVQDQLTVIVYRAGKETRSRGTLLSLAFVPKNFKLKTDEQIAEEEQKLISIADSGEADVSMGMPPAPGAEQGPEGNEDELRRAAMLKFIGENLRQPLADEKREVGSLEKIECVKDKIFFHVRTTVQVYRFRAVSPNDVIFKAYTNDIGAMRIGCGAAPPSAPAVITFRPNKDPKAKDNGDIIAVEFVPKSFKLP